MKGFKLFMAVLVFCLFAGSALAGEFSADMTTKGMGMTMPGKIFVKGQKFRRESNMQGQASASIMDMAAKKTYVLMPAQKMYMEHTMDPAKNQDKTDPKEWESVADVKYLGTETIQGYVCDKIQMTMKDGTGTGLQWHSKKLGYAVRSIFKTKEGEMSTELSNIKEGGVADSLFVVPAGWTKMQMPKGMGRPKQ